MTSPNHPTSCVIISSLALAFLVSSCGDDGGGSGSPDARSFDGFGNNAAQPKWGAAGTTLRRVAAAAYGDDTASPAGQNRPGARAISNAVAAQSESIPNSHGLSGFVFQWGQFIDHDLSLTDLMQPAEPLDIPIPAGDPMFDPHGTGTATLVFTRSRYDLATGTDPANPRQQINELTAYLDASMVYGSSEDRALALRSFDGGKLLTSAGDRLPFNTLGLPNADLGPMDRERFYVAGDLRANEQPGLTAMHTLFVREHNRLCDELSAQHPKSDDETLYQEARRRVGALVQVITFNEFLPAILGALAPAVESLYDPDLDATIATEFSAALYRVGHTMLPPELLRLNDDGTPAPAGPLPLRDAFFLTANLEADGELESLLKGLAMLEQQEIDNHVVDGVRNFLFGDPIVGPRFDLIALNLQRGRDHGLPDYNTVRRAYGLEAKRSISEISSDPEVVAALESVYTDIDDIDVWIAAVSEDHVPGAAAGELIVAALREQFIRLRDGDRFWYRNDPAFSGAAIEELEATRLSDVILRNTGLTTLQAEVFHIPSR